MKYTIDYNLRTIDFNQNDDITPYAVLNYFQDIARVHATKLNVGYDNTIGKNILWVLTKTKFEFFNKFTPEEVVRVTTWPSEIGRITFNRDYEIFHGEQLLVKGTSQWVVIDSNTRRILKPDMVDFPHAYDYGNYIKDKFDKVEVFDLELYNLALTHKVVNSDLDHYMHVNNASYARMIFDGLDVNYAKNIKTFEINYIKETVFEEILNVFVYEKDNCIYGIIKNDMDVIKVTFCIVY